MRREPEGWTYSHIHYSRRYWKVLETCRNDVETWWKIFVGFRKLFAQWACKALPDVLQLCWRCRESQAKSCADGVQIKLLWPTKLLRQQPQNWVFSVCNCCNWSHLFTGMGCEDCDGLGWLHRANTMSIMVVALVRQHIWGPCSRPSALRHEAREDDWFGGAEGTGRNSEISKRSKGTTCSKQKIQETIVTQSTTLEWK